MCTGDIVHCGTHLAPASTTRSASRPFASHFPDGQIGFATGVRGTDRMSSNQHSRAFRLDSISRPRRAARMVERSPRRVLHPAATDPGKNTRAGGYCAWHPARARREFDVIAHPSREPPRRCADTSTGVAIRRTVVTTRDCCGDRGNRCGDRGNRRIGRGDRQQSPPASSGCRCAVGGLGRVNGRLGRRSLPIAVGSDQWMPTPLTNGCRSRATGRRRRGGAGRRGR